EVALDPLGLTVLDAGGRVLVRLASEPPAEGALAGIAPFAWLRSVSDDGLRRHTTTASLTLEPDERLFGLGQRTAPLDLVGTTRFLPPMTAVGSEVGARPPFLLSSRGYGVLVHTAAALTAELGERALSAFTVAVDGSALDLLIFPST